jgi:cellulose synthase/poly-beta-1,6-N-acetylglucosamine synthase-like glycosyltransferase
LSASSWVAVVALVLLIYTYVGYPLLIGLLARLWPWRPSPVPGWEPTVSICVAAYNCEAYIGAKLRSLLALDYPADKMEILIYSDASSDGTDAIVTACAALNPRVILLRGETRMGKPTALNRMRERATGEVLVITDARQPLDRAALRSLLSLLAAPQVGCVTGNLVLDGSAGSGVYWRYENWIRKQESRFGSVTGMTGPLSALRRCDLGPLPKDLILDDVWIPMQLRLRKARVLFAEDAIARDRAFSDEREFGRKTRTLAGNYQLFWRMPRLLLPFVNPSWFETISHKIARLLCPWLLLALLLACSIGALDHALGGLERQTLGGLLLAQIVFYALATAGSRAGRVGTVARTFVVLNAAAVVGLGRFLAGSQRVTW